LIILLFGHIHKLSYNNKNNINYPGSMISFGFDELGEHGMLDVELEKDKDVKIKFIKLDERIFEELNLDISEINSEEELIEEINNLKLEKNKMYKLILIGNKNFKINLNKIIKLIFNKNIIKIKNNTKLNEDIYKMIEENSLKGFFIQEILDKLKSGEIDEETMKKVIEIGLEVL